MSTFLGFTIRFLQPYSHGRGEDGNPEWPPSPLRLIQALVAASAGYWNERQTLQHPVPALEWLESLPAPAIVCPPGTEYQTPYQLFVPDNTGDLLVPAWKRGDLNKQVKRTEKWVHPVRLDGEEVHFLYALPAVSGDWQQFVEILTNAARAITHFGWGIDMTIGNAQVISGEVAYALPGLRWEPGSSHGLSRRAAKPGTVSDLIRRHYDFLNRMGKDGFRPVPPLRTFDLIHYQLAGQPVPKPFRVFELRNQDGSRFRYPPRRLIHVAGMVRHLAIEAMRHDPPPGVASDWVEAYVAGHSNEELGPHRQFSYLPLPSVGYEHTDPGVRRMMIAAPVGDEAWLNHLARRLAGQMLEAVHGNEFPNSEPPLLVPVRHDSVARNYLRSASEWHSFTPVILPGHDDHRPAKTRALIERALVQSGIDQPCDFEWFSYCKFARSYSAHKYDKDKKPQGYLRPSYLVSNTAVHLTLHFHDGSLEKNPVAVSGPITVGAGRHCGLGLFVADRLGISEKED